MRTGTEESGCNIPYQEHEKVGIETASGDGLHAARNILGHVDMTYGPIAEYLSDPDAAAYTLELISRDLWRAYDEPIFVPTKGRPTRTLRQAAANYSFIYGDPIVYTDPLHPLTFMNYGAIHPRCLVRMNQSSVQRQREPS